MVYDIISSSQKRGSFALLIDPDKHTPKSLKSIAIMANESSVDMFLVGGSLVRKNIDNAIVILKDFSDIPVVLFPGSVFQLSPKADAILLLSLISGRNPDFLIGNHVLAAHAIKESGMEVIPTGYMLFESDKISSVQYMSNTSPIPAAKIDIAVATAIAGQQLGLKAIYLEGGSGSQFSLSSELIREVKTNVNLPVIVGGGLRTPSQINLVRKAGATLVVVGNVLESNPEILSELVAASR